MRILVLILTSPIQTYQGLGSAKKHAVKNYHSIVFTAPEPLKPQTAECRILSSIRIKPRKSGDTIDPMARLNYTKIYTVEHNVKVYDLGEVHWDYLEMLNNLFKQVS